MNKSENSFQKSLLVAEIWCHKGNRYQLTFSSPIHFLYINTVCLHYKTLDLVFLQVKVEKSTYLLEKFCDSSQLKGQRSLRKNKPWGWPPLSTRWPNPKLKILRKILENGWSQNSPFLQSFTQGYTYHSKILGQYGEYCCGPFCFSLSKQKVILKWPKMALNGWKQAILPLWGTWGMGPTCHR